jgi:hypothetical protein
MINEFTPEEIIAETDLDRFGPLDGMLSNEGKLRCMLIQVLKGVDALLNPWHTHNPEEGDYICRTDDCGIRMCHYTGSEWLEMWKTEKAYVKEWMTIPYNDNNSV